jgi:hypothetical protein
MTKRNLASAASEACPRTFLGARLLRSPLHKVNVHSISGEDSLKGTYSSYISTEPSFLLNTTATMSSATSTPARPAKAMSSKLLTMKFMQRGAASPSSAPGTPHSPSTPNNEPSAKRHKSAHNTPQSESEFDVRALADQRAVMAALEDEEAKRQAVLERQAAEAGDTRWVLRFGQEAWQTKERGHGGEGLRVVEAGFASIDTPQKSTEVYEDEERPAMVGRRSFGRFNRAIEVCCPSASSLVVVRREYTNPPAQKLQDPDAESSSSEDEDEDEEDAEAADSDADADADSDDPTTALLREISAETAKKAKEERKAKRKAEKAGLKKLAEKRKKKEVKLNTLTSISGGSGGGSSNQTCYRCGKLGHVKSECPMGEGGRNGGGEAGRRGKKRKST